MANYFKVLWQKAPILSEFITRNKGRSHTLMFLFKIELCKVIIISKLSKQFQILSTFVLQVRTPCRYLQCDALGSSYDFSSSCCLSRGWTKKASFMNMKGGVHILGENCPRSYPDITHILWHYPTPHMYKLSIRPDLNAVHTLPQKRNSSLVQLEVKKLGE